MWVCNRCHVENDDTAGFCSECGASKPHPSENHCSNPDCKSYNVILSDSFQKHCNTCGSLTTFGKMIDDLC